MTATEMAGIFRGARLLRFVARGGASAMLAFVLLLGACGGGFIAGVGSGGTGLAEGMVSGFGSVIVDGVKYDDSRATVFVTDSTGAPVQAALNLGQRVRIVFGQGNIAQSVQLLPQLAGPVTAPPDANGWLQVMGQWVRLVVHSENPSQGTVTVLAGYPSLDRIALSDDVEIHGSWVYDAGRAGYVLWATRLEKLSAAIDPVQLGGVVQSLGGGIIRLGSAAGLAVRPPHAMAELTKGQVVRVWLARKALNTGSVADAIRVERTTPTAEELAGLSSIRISGQASRYDPATRTVEVQGLRVQLAGDVAVDEARLALGHYVALGVVVKAGGLIAVSAEQRGGAGGNALGATVDITGVISGVDWTAPNVALTLHGVEVRAPRVVIDGSCLAVGTQAVQVRVQGRLNSGAGPLVASSVTCI